MGSGGAGVACGILASVEGLLVCNRFVTVYFILGFLKGGGFGLLDTSGFVDLSSSGGLVADTDEGLSGTGIDSGGNVTIILLAEGSFEPLGLGLSCGDIVKVRGLSGLWLVV